MPDYGLGRFGDRRLEKGGLSYMPVWWRRAGGVCVCADWAAAAPARFA